jgi:hypothetical protein
MESYIEIVEKGGDKELEERDLIIQSEEIALEEL